MRPMLTITADRVREIEMARGWKATSGKLVSSCSVVGKQCWFIVWTWRRKA